MWWDLQQSLDCKFNAEDIGGRILKIRQYLTQFGQKL